MRLLVSLALGSWLMALPATAEDDASDMTCESYLKIIARIGAAPTTGDADTDRIAAKLDAKVASYCEANPDAKIMEVIRKVGLGLI